MDFSEYVAIHRTGLVRAAGLLGCPRAYAEDVEQMATRAWTMNGRHHGAQPLIETRGGDLRSPSSSGSPRTD